MERIQNDNFISQDLENKDLNEENFDYYKNRKNLNNNINNYTSKFESQLNKNEKEFANDNINIKNSFLDKQIIPERTISNYYGNEFLTDAILKIENYEISFHKIILCSASDFLNNYFTLNPDISQKAIVNLPEMINSL